MPVATVRALLVAEPVVTALVPADRIEALRRTQGFAIPAITLQRVSTVPFNELRGNGGLDANVVQIDYYGADYTALRHIADVCRATLEAGGLTMQNEIDGYESDTDPELYHLIQTWSVFT